VATDTADLPLALAADPARPFGVYVHVPYCATRCSYCDFVTYTAEELRGRASRSGYAAQAIAEISLAARSLGGTQAPASTVFFGGGTPTLLPPADLASILAAIDDELGLAPGAEVTVEANPDSVDPASLAALRAGGVTRISFGMQSARAHVLDALGRTHTPGRPAAAAREAREAGFDHVSLDLIYGAPAETGDDWRASLEEALSAEPDHVSAYALTVMPGTRLHADVRRGAVPPPDEDALADRYAVADELLSSGGLRWYEISNWAAGPDARCRHNLAYWQGGDWWGVGPGAHSHVSGTRWWNVRHPADHAARLAEHRSPAEAGEVLDAGQRRLERIMLEIRTAEGLDTGVLSAAGLAAAQRLAGDGLLDPAPLLAGTAVLTLRGRQLGDLVIRSIAAD
jgi:oxygen-independent coproporphyrinogen-3 oxidase